MHHLSWIPFQLFQHMFRYLWITVLQTSLVPLYLNNSLSICLPHQLNHLPLAPYISWLTLIAYILHTHTTCQFPTATTSISCHQKGCRTFQTVSHIYVIHI